MIELTFPLLQDPIHGAQLAGEWGTREAFTSVVTTNLPMIFPLLKPSFKPLFGSALPSNKTNSKHPTGLRTVGKGGADLQDLVDRLREGMLLIMSRSRQVRRGL